MKPYLKLMTLTLVGLIVFSCDSPTNTKSLRTSFQITGTVALAGSWPETGQVLVNLFSKEDIDANTWSNVRDFEHGIRLDQEEHTLKLNVEDVF